MTNDICVPRLGVNIDHVATIRNARGGGHPDPVRAAILAANAGADGITAHLREDRRHIGDRDIDLLMGEIGLPLNLEMAATDEMLSIALRHKPHASCLVPEKRQELTTEGGLDVKRGHNHLVPYVHQLREAGIRVSLFIDADPSQIEASHNVGAQVIEIHVGTYCDLITAKEFDKADEELARVRAGATMAHELGLEVHVGHGITFDSVKPIAAMPEVMELNIGHFLIGEAVFSGLDSAIKRMKDLILIARRDEAGIQFA